MAIIQFDGLPCWSLDASETGTEEYKMSVSRGVGFNSVWLATTRNILKKLNLSKAATTS